MTGTRNSARASGITRGLAVVGAGALALGAATVLIDLFGSALPYSFANRLNCALDSDEFLEFLSVVTNGAVRRARVTRLTNGEQFYPAQLAAIRSARRAVILEQYEFAEGRVSGEFLDALVERARAGVAVRIMVDAAGSFRTHDAYFDRLRAAGGQMHWYNPLRPQKWQTINNRTHRKLLVVDGEVGFIGGAGIADYWLYSSPKVPAWRDTMFRMEGEGVAGLISTFSENWLESSGEILSGDMQFGFEAKAEGPRGFVVLSTPHGGGTQARILFQALIRSARKSLRITTPYFLPDHSARAALAEAARRGIDVQILTAGPHIDHPVVRKLSRESSRRLLRAGAEIYEYQPSMIHAKLMTVDGEWSVVGSTNFDHRSFGLNDEVNLAVFDREMAAGIEQDFEEDLRQSRRLTPAMLEERGFFLLDHALKWES
ncbi:MAG: phospholipase D-like domain-containing protein [Acidobacteriota bacterium]